MKGACHTDGLLFCIGIPWDRPLSTPTGRHWCIILEVVYRGCPDDISYLLYCETVTK